MAEQLPELQRVEFSEAEEMERLPMNPAEGSSKETGSFVVFRLDGKRLALPLDQVKLALRMVSVTPVPDAPPWVIGVIDLHGLVIPVTDLRQRLGHPAKEPHLDDRLLVMSLAERTFALVVDEVTEVLELQGSEVETPPDLLCDSRYLRAVVRREDGLILILNSANLFPSAAGGKVLDA
jgi:purine-binding chemotaxis protein CheW